MHLVSLGDGVLNLKLLSPCVNAFSISASRLNILFTLELPAVRDPDQPDLRQVADAADLHLHRHHQLRRLEHPLPRSHHLLQQPRRHQAVQRRAQKETVRYPLLL